MDILYSYSRLAEPQNLHWPCELSFIVILFVIEMLPKVSFIGDKNETNGNECLSRRGKMTTFHYPIFQSKDPIAVHEKAMKRVQKEQKSMTHGIIPGKPPTQE